MIYDGIQHIKLAKLPSPEKLWELQTEGFNHLVNVSGIDLFQLYGEFYQQVYRVRVHQKQNLLKMQEKYIL